MKKYTKHMSCALKSFLVLIILFIFTEADSQRQVFISSGNTIGQGLLYANEGSCYVILPDHVTYNALNINDGYKLVTEDNRNPTATYLSFLQDDTALLRVSGGEKPYCPSLPTVKTSELNVQLKNLKETWLSIITSTGAIDRIYVTTIRREGSYMVVRPVNNRDLLKEGYSGSLLMGKTNDGREIWLGMLREIIDITDNTGEVQLANLTTLLRDNYYALITPSSVEVDLFKGAKSSKRWSLIAPAAAVGIGSMLYGYQSVFKRSKDIYSLYEMFPNPSDFVSNVSNFESRTAAYNRAEELRSQSLWWIIGGGAALAASAGIYLFYDKAPVDIGLSSDGLGLIYSF